MDSGAGCLPAGDVVWTRVEGCGAQVRALPKRTRVSDERYDHDPLDPRATSVEVLLDRLKGEGTFDERAKWLEDLAGWMFGRGAWHRGLPGREGLACAKEPLPTLRLGELLEMLDHRPGRRDEVRAGVAHVFAGLDDVRLFSDTGLPSETGLLAEGVQRGTKSLLPELPIERDAATLLHHDPLGSGTSFFAAFTGVYL